MIGTEFSRRQFLATVGVAGAGIALLPATAQAEPRRSGIAYVGSFTSRESPGHGLEVVLHEPPAPLRPIPSRTRVADASYLAFSPSGNRMYCTNEQAPAGTVTAIGVDDPTAPHVLNSQPTRGTGPTHLSVHPSGRFLLTANYTYGSIAVHPLDDDGSLGELTELYRHPAGVRDPLAHQVVTDPSGRWVVSVDLGTDTVHTSTLDLRTGRLSPHEQLALPDRTGPRHLTFHPDGRHAYLVSELASTVTVLGWNAETGTFTTGEVIPTRAAGNSGENFPAEIAVSPDGRFVYAANRGDDDLAVFSVHGGGAHLVLVDNTPTGGNWPRHFTFSPDESALLVANERSGTVTVLPRDRRTGVLSAPKQPGTAHPSAAVIAFHPGHDSSTGLRNRPV